MVKVAVCDDEKIIRDQIVTHIAGCGTFFDVQEFSSGVELLQYQESFDIIFLDIEMPELNGMEVADELRVRKTDSCIIFLTSHIECMPEAFKVRAFRFLNKPIDTDTFMEALIEAEKEVKDVETVIIQNKGVVSQIRVKDIVYLEAYGDGTYIYDRFQNVYTSNQSLREWEKKLDNNGFYKIHKSYMVSMYYVKRIDKNLLALEHTQELLTIARRNVTSFKDAYMQFIRMNARVL